MLQEPAVFGDEVDRERVFAALGLDASDAHPELPPQVVSTGLAHLMIPARDDDVLHRARPDNALLDALLSELRRDLRVPHGVRPAPTTPRRHAATSRPTA